MSAIEAYVGVTEADTPDAKLHAVERTIGANDVRAEVMVQGEQYLPHYIVSAGGVGTGTDNEHLVQIMAGASLSVRIRRISIRQAAIASAVGTAEFALMRLTTAGSGGSAVTPAEMDEADPAAGATFQTLPSSKGTEGTTVIRRIPIGLVAAQPVGTTNVWEWVQPPGGTPIIIPAGTSNGLVLKVVEPVVGATVAVVIDFSETAW